MVKVVWRSDVSKGSVKTSVPEVGNVVLPKGGTRFFERSTDALGSCKDAAGKRRGPRGRVLHDKVYFFLKKKKVWRDSSK